MRSSSQVYSSCSFFSRTLVRVALTAASLLFLLISVTETHAQDTGPARRANSLFRIGRLKYSGGGDWYNDPSCEPNLLRFVREHTNIEVDPQYLWVDIASDEIFNYPFLFVTGHGNIELADGEVKRLRAYLEAGGFLYIDDDYGMDQSIRREMKKVFPEQEFQELPFSYGLYHAHFDFPHGLPKIHEHDNKTPQGFGLFVGKRLAVYYSYETNPSDGWADPDVHNDPEQKRDEALKFGTNLVVWSLEH
jgi:hypothetical protein